ALPRRSTTCLTSQRVALPPLAMGHFLNPPPIGRTHEFLPRFSTTPYPSTKLAPETHSMGTRNDLSWDPVPRIPRRARPVGRARRGLRCFWGEDNRAMFPNFGVWPVDSGLSSEVPTRLRAVASPKQFPPSTF